MAPTRSTSSSITAPRKSILKNATHSRQPEPEPLFPPSKRDKRKIKHEQLISKIAKSAKPKARRRRPSKKLVTTLDALADALPTAEDATVPRFASGDQIQDQVNIITRKSMKSKPGAMKRREKIDRAERDRFAKNLAQMALNKDQQMVSSTRSSQTLRPEDKWKALRGFIAQTMERRSSPGT